MHELAGRFATASTLPIMLDSTEPAVIEAGLEMLGGRCIVNSVNFEDGDGPTSRYARVMPIVSEHGAAVVALTMTAARELGPKGITANAVAPGLIDTEIGRSMPAEVLAEAVARIPARRLGRAEEVASVYLFLASDLASFVNGAVVGVDGGLLL